MKAIHHRVGVIIAAGGVGRRMGGKTPKQFVLLAGRPVIARTIAVFESIAAVREIVVVAPRRYLGRMNRLIRSSRFKKVNRIVAGGKERQDSVRAGLFAFHPPPDLVLVHDAVRPFVSRETVRNVIRAAGANGAAVVGVRVKDTVKVESPPGYYARTLDRRRLWTVQTPQGFRFRLLREAHERARKAGVVGTDESSLVERMGRSVRIVEGSEKNIKLTTREDLNVASSLLMRRRTPHRRRVRAR